MGRELWHYQSGRSLGSRQPPVRTSEPQECLGFCCPHRKLRWSSWLHPSSWPSSDRCMQLGSEAAEERLISAFSLKHSFKKEIICYNMQKIFVSSHKSKPVSLWNTCMKAQNFFTGIHYFFPFVFFSLRCKNMLK